MPSNRKSISARNFGEASKPFVDAGIPTKALLPIIPVDAELAPTTSVNPESRGKAPGRYDEHTGSWWGLSGPYKTKGVPGREQNAMHSWPTANVGLIGRFAPAIDCDTNTPEAARLAERAVAATFGDKAPIAKRLRDNSPRLLFAFEAADPDDPRRNVQPWSIKWLMPGEGDDCEPHRVDMIGFGGQFVIAGTHPSGAEYGWHSEFSLTELWESKEILCIEQADAEKFREALDAEIEAAGGQIVSTRKGGASGPMRDYSNEPPVVPPEVILAGLARLPNTSKNFPTREDIVKICSFIRAALGCESENYIEKIRDWACNSGNEPGLCEPEWFDKIWYSLERGVRVSRDSLDILFRRRGIYEFAKHEFCDGADEARAAVAEHQARERDGKSALLAEVAEQFIFGKVNVATDNKMPTVRAKSAPAIAWEVRKWWNFHTHCTEVQLIRGLREQWGDKPDGMWVFLRDLEHRHPASFFLGTTRHPEYAYGACVPERDSRGVTTYKLNEREQPEAEMLAQKASSDPEQARADYALFRDLVKRIFGPHADYELSTLAYMVQTGKRPGHCLVLVGDQGVGKSIYAEILVALFDGDGPNVESNISGAALVHDGARRFVFENSEGCRIINIRELPANMKSADASAITSIIKQNVDAGPGGDFVRIEGKGKKGRPIRNFARFVIVTNYRDALPFEENDRRTFYVVCGITLDNKPRPDFYKRLMEIRSNPERLANLWRFLDTFEISNYDVHKPPPASNEKLERQIASIADAADRHMEAALRTLRHAGRRTTTMHEIRALMNEMANRDSPSWDTPTEYGSGVRGNITRAAYNRLERQTEKHEYRSGSSRLPTIYVFKDFERELTGMKRHEVLNVLETDRQHNPIREACPLAPYAGPLTLPRADDDERQPGPRLKVVGGRDGTD